MKNNLKQLFWSSRPISWVNTAYPFFVGSLLTTHQVTSLTIIGTIYFLIPYNLTMYGINDVFDYESDILNPRKGGIEGAKLQKPLHRLTIWAAILTSLPFLVYLWSHGSRAANAVLLYITFMVLAYSLPLFRFKEWPFLDSFTSSTHFVGPLVYALVLTGWSQAYWPYVIAFFLWGMASHAFGAVQDIKADRQADIASIGTVLGAKPTVWFALLLYIASAAIMTMVGWQGWVVAGLALLYAANVWRFRRITDKQCEQANAGWKVFLKLNWLSGFIITLLVIVELKGWF